jgi:hypothetical protein
VVSQGLGADPVQHRARATVAGSTARRHGVADLLDTGAISGGPAVGTRTAVTSPTVLAG